MAAGDSIDMTSDPRAIVATRVFDARASSCSRCGAIPRI